MAITRWTNNRPFEGLLRRWRDDIDRWFNEDDDFLFSADRSWNPAVDIEEKNGKYHITADLPGVKKDDITVELHDGYLTLRGERHSEHEDKKQNYHRIERAYGSFERSFRVPEGVTEKDIEAKYHDGVLELAVPAPKAEQAKAIPIK